MKRVFSAVMFILLVTSMLTMALQIQPVRASETIYIRADGSIDPPTAPISTVDNVTYILTGNISSDADGIVVERSNIIIDGDGCTISGTGTENGFYVSGITNVTIKNTNIKSFLWGIRLYVSSNSSIFGNNITANNSYGILLESSSFNSIFGNNITANKNEGIVVSSYSEFNSIFENNITNSDDGIRLDGSSYNSILRNMFSQDGLTVSNSYGNVVLENFVNDKPLVYLEDVSGFTIEDAGQVILVNCIGITVENLNLSNTSIGIQLLKTNNTKISGNNITANNYSGIMVDKSSYNSISGNNITANNREGIMLEWSSNNSIFENSIRNSEGGINLYVSSNNTISGNSITNSDEGIWLAYSCYYNSIVGNNITANNYEGIWLYNRANNNSISGNNITANARAGITLGWGSNNSIFENSITDNDYGVYIYGSSNSCIYHNDFIDNAAQVYSSSDSANVWDDGYPSGGNFWSDYDGVDLFSDPYQNMTGSDGIGDTPYIIDANNTDRYPLINLYFARARLLGDVNDDGKVNVRDVMVAVQAFNSFQGQPRWNVAADLDNSGRVDMRDLVIIVLNFNKHE